METEEKSMSAIERAELNLLVQRGFKFEIRTGNRNRTFEIHQPTLYILDKISEISLDMVIDENDFTEESNEILSKARKLVRLNVKRMAMIIAIAVLGESYYSNIPLLKQILNVLYRIKLRKLRDIFYHTIKPSELLQISTVVTNISNLADFLSSMRLLSSARTTQPITDRIEKQE
ncbi:MAG: hypothetical protein FWF53_03000 [Candidatus Azobacteroides sp.]|nr:hypothetical protein [Candidatus Azobacteroides sp.]